MAVDLGPGAERERGLLQGDGDPADAAPSTRPAGITVPLQGTIDWLSASDTPAGARRVVNEARPDRVVPAALAATTRQ